MVQRILAGAFIATLLTASSCDKNDSNETANDNLPDVTGYPIVGTNQTTYYDNQDVITRPDPTNVFYGQNASYPGNTPKYQDNGDGTITDLVTGLMWTKSPDLNGDGIIDYSDKLSYDEAVAFASDYELGGYTDWRLPSIKEQFSLIDFSGKDPSGYEGTSTDGLVPFINTDYFDFAYGDEIAGERIIDAQFVTSTKYVSTTMMGDETVFGVNFADGRIKGYPVGPMPGRTENKKFYVYFVRGNNSYGENDFIDNGDGTITDSATELMWTKDDNGEGLTWEEALEYAQNADIAGYTDWRLPDVKELQSIVDYTRSPSTSSSPAIDPVFNCSQIINEAGEIDYPYYWSSTTHANWTENSGNSAAYVSFGRAMGYMNQWMDVHGAGAQRSDPKVGDPNDYPTGRGPQGDAIRIYNYVRLVRNVNTK